MLPRSKWFSFFLHHIFPINRLYRFTENNGSDLLIAYESVQLRHYTTHLSGSGEAKSSQWVEQQVVQGVIYFPQKIR